jgi:hypothetical protein
VKFVEGGLTAPIIHVRYFQQNVDVPKTLPQDDPPVMSGTVTSDYTRIYSPRRYLWFFKGIEDEKLVRQMYEGRTAGGKEIKRKMLAF